MMGKVKIGDRVRAVASIHDVTGGRDYRVVDVGEGGTVWVNDDDGALYPLWSSEYYTPLSPNDTVRLKSGEPFTTGSYTATVDSATEDKVILTHGSWLPLDAVEKVEAGAGEEPKFKVGDRVRVVKTGIFRTGTNVGDVGTVTSVELGGRVDGQDRIFFDLNHCTDGIIEQVCDASDIELAPEPGDAKPSDLENLVVTLSVDLSEYEAQLNEAVRLTSEALSRIEPGLEKIEQIKTRFSGLSTDDRECLAAQGIPATDHLAGISNAPDNDNDDFVTVSISGHPVAVADFLAVLR